MYKQKRGQSQQKSKIKPDFNCLKKTGADNRIEINNSQINSKLFPHFLNY